jgi:predicted secreted protein with PEFG-CTERM motif
MVDAGATVNFNASNSTDNIGIVSYAWNFGDDTTGTGISATHVYSNSGTYNVSLTVEDAAGNRDTQSVTVTVLYVIPEFPSVALLIVFIMVSSALTLSFRIKCKPSRQNV